MARRLIAAWTLSGIRVRITSCRSQFVRAPWIMIVNGNVWLLCQLCLTWGKGLRLIGDDRIVQQCHVASLLRHERHARSMLGVCRWYGMKSECMWREIWSNIWAFDWEFRRVYAYVIHCCLTLSLKGLAIVYGKIYFLKKVVCKVFSCSEGRGMGSLLFSLSLYRVFY